MIDELIRRVFAARDAAHREHWGTESYAAHQATGSFYDTSVESLDSFIEARQGAFGRVTDSNQQKLIEQLSRDVVWIGENRKELSNGMPALENLLDGLCADYLSAIYKLENLR